MTKPLILIAVLLCTAAVMATESRIESMGKRDLFFRDDMSIFSNPADVGVLGNFITGSLGFVSDSSKLTLTNPRLVQTPVLRTFRDTLHTTGLADSIVSFSYMDTISRLEADTSVTPGTATPANQWFGVVYNQPLSQALTVFGGAAFNREDPYLDFYQALKGRHHYRTDKYGHKLAFPDLKGKSDYILGAKFGTVNAGVGIYSAKQHLVEDNNRYDVSVALRRINLGTEVGLGKNSLELYAGMGMINYFNKVDSTVPSDIDKRVAEKTDNSIFASGRFFLQTTLGGGLVFVPAVRYTSLKLFDSVDTRISGGVGLNYRLDGGFFWAGLEGEKYTSEKDSQTTSGVGARLNFGIEKSLIWKWLIVRVGGNKFIGRQDIEITGQATPITEWVENPVDDGGSEDMLGFGIGLNYQNRLRFDITLNEALPYFNPFGKGLQNSENGGHMLLRISSTFSL